MRVGFSLPKCGLFPRSALYSDTNLSFHTEWGFKNTDGTLASTIVPAVSTLSVPDYSLPPPGTEQMGTNTIETNSDCQANGWGTWIGQVRW
jgi:hypothetical protein